MNIKTTYKSYTNTHLPVGTHTSVCGKYLYKVEAGVVKMWDEYGVEWINSLMSVDNLVEID
jgi:hypothetical protein